MVLRTVIIMPTLIIAADSTTRIAGTSPEDLTTDEKTIRLTQPEFDALPSTVLSYPHNWNNIGRVAEIVFDLATYRTQAIEAFTVAVNALRDARFASTALTTSYTYDTDQASLLLLIAGAVSDQGTMLTTYTGETPTDRTHTAMQVQAVLRSFFDSRAAIATRFRTASAAVNAATTQQAIDAVTL